MQECNYSYLGNWYLLRAKFTQIWTFLLFAAAAAAAAAATTTTTIFGFGQQPDFSLSPA